MYKDIYNNKEDLLNFLVIKENYLYYDLFSKRYGEKKIPKKGGGYRTIKPPNSKLKLVQNKIFKDILSNVKHLQCVFGLSKDKTILENAKFHSSNKNYYLLNLDVEKFYPNIKPKMVKEVFVSLGFSVENSKILTKICTVDGQLPQGSPTSPILSSLVFNKIDKKIYSYCNNNKLIYSRYFDDVTISGHKIELVHEDSIKKIINKGGFNLNDEKRDFFGLKDEKNINKVVIKERSYDVSSDYKTEIKKCFDKYKKINNIKNHRKFMGKMGFYLYINRVKAEKYFKDITGFDFNDRGKLLRLN